MSFQPEGDHSTVDNMHLLYGVLPHEVVCTENLTPFLKLLPCKGKAGIASLLDGHKLFDSSWQSMAIDIRPICPPDGECVLQIEQTIDMVLDIDRSKRPRGTRPLPASSTTLSCTNMTQIIPSLDLRRAINCLAIPQSPTTPMTPASLMTTPQTRTGRSPKSSARPSRAPAPSPTRPRPRSVSRSPNPAASLSRKASARKRTLTTSRAASSSTPRPTLR
jgi:hypothetical protein